MVSVRRQLPARESLVKNGGLLCRAGHNARPSRWLPGAPRRALHRPREAGVATPDAPPPDRQFGGQKSCLEPTHTTSVFMDRYLLFMFLTVKVAGRVGSPSFQSTSSSDSL